jgi:hypothetical protein
MESSGLRLDWRNRDDNAASDSFSDLAVVEFRGSCRMAAPDVPYDAAGPLARTHLEDGKILRFSEVDCDQVRASLHSASGSRLAGQSDLVLGRALARVLAHELYHVQHEAQWNTELGRDLASVSHCTTPWDQNRGWRETSSEGGLKAGPRSLRVMVSIGLITQTVNQGAIEILDRVQSMDGLCGPMELRQNQTQSVRSAHWPGRVVFVDSARCRNAHQPPAACTARGR